MRILAYDRELTHESLGVLMTDLAEFIDGTARQNQIHTGTMAPPLSFEQGILTEEQREAFYVQYGDAISDRLKSRGIPSLQDLSAQAASLLANVSKRMALTRHDKMFTECHDRVMADVRDAERRALCEKKAESLPCDTIQPDDIDGLDIDDIVI